MGIGELVKKLLLLDVISLVASLSDVHCLIHASCEVHQGITRLAPCQSFIAPSESGRGGERRVVEGEGRRWEGWEGREQEGSYE